MHIRYVQEPQVAGRYQDAAPVRKCARAWEMVHDTPADTAVLCLHGFTGYPGELVRPGIDLYEAGFDVFCPRYPGHGTSGADFRKSRASDWIGTASDALKELQGRYSQVYLVGHSMGGAIAILLSQAFGIKRQVLFAPALRMPNLKPWKLWFARLFYGSKPIETPWKADPSYVMFHEGDLDDDAYLGAEYWSWLYPLQLTDIQQVSKMAVACLDHLECDTLVICGDQDTTVDPQVGAMVVRMAPMHAKTMLVAGGTHLLPYDKVVSAREEANEACVRWFLQ